MAARRGARRDRKYGLVAGMTAAVVLAAAAFNSRTLSAFVGSCAGPRSAIAAPALRRGQLCGRSTVAPVHSRRGGLSALSAQGKGVVAVLGGGIIGVSIAYFLAKEKGREVVVIERERIAAAAGGKGGGFLAKRWGDGSPTQPLHRVSFDLHAQLAEKLGISSYRSIPVLSVTGGPGRGYSEDVCSWLDGEVAEKRLMDTDTAQVMPAEYCSVLMAAAEEAGARVHIGKVSGLETHEEDSGTTVSAVLLEDGERVECEQVVCAMGPWSVLMEEWLPQQVVPMEGVWSTSLVFKKEPGSVEPYALFCAEDEFGCHIEVYPRNNGEIYICGCGGSKYVQSAELKRNGPEDITPDPQRVKAATAAFSRMSSLGEGGPTVTQACMRPCPPDAAPMLGLLPGTSNAFIAAGHNCWGILWAPVTGKLMSELMTDGEVQCVPGIENFDPARFNRSARRMGKRGRKQGTRNVGEQW
eukprot:TRINITY_DN92294_c0_g1_i1.p1 TRINITY_DN92294_c0_g1~~TRINITY_DN92294_c0_g1_i1.p1  ORF type:complete len:468 (+),score=104.10 TRINITY_DN92294_c0_g1_i1:93-1496(+)